MQSHRPSPGSLWPLILALGLVTGSGLVQAGGMLKIDDTKWVSIGAGIKTSFRASEDSAPSGSDWSKDFNVDSARIYINGQVHEYIKLEFNTEKEGDANVRILDVVGKFEFSDYANFWVGRFLPAVDRFNLDGPYYLNTYDFPIVQGYPAIFAGRDDGISYWGQHNGGQFKWQFGAFQGCSDSNACGASGANTEDNLLYTYRFVYNVFDPEPGYYNSSTYYGAKDILAIGVAGAMQSDATGTAANPADLNIYSVDVLFEKPMPGGVLTAEGAWFNYDYDDATNTPGLFPQGDSYLLSGAWLFPQQVGIGQLQPQLRYQNVDTDAGVETEQWEAMLNYIIDGHNAKVTFSYGNTEVSGGGASTDSDFILVGLQLQI